MKNEIYKQLSTPPANALKNISAGRLKGKSDINPQWRYEVMTETFGMCGFGWKYEIVNREFVPASDNQIAVFVDINLFIKQGDKWSEPIPANGGSMFITQERNGLHVSDEGVKMATTDALGTAMKMIGVAANIYRGLSGNNTPPQTKHEEQGQKPTEQHKKLKKLPNEKFKDAVKFLKGGKSMKELKSYYEIDEETEFKLITAAEA